jgi:hypothetical protein
MDRDLHSPQRGLRARSPEHLFLSALFWKSAGSDAIYGALLVCAQNAEGAMNRAPTFSQRGEIQLKSYRDEHGILQV